MADTPGDGPPRAALIAAVVLAVGAAVGFLVFAAVTQHQRGPAPVALSAVPAPRADGPECARLIGTLPEKAGDSLYNQPRFSTFSSTSILPD